MAYPNFAVPNMVYVYECESPSGSPPNYYIGHTNNIHRRHAEHLSGTAAAWTKLHHPVKFIEIQLGSDELEQQLTIKYMREKGIANVRGGAWTTINLSDETLTAIRQQINSVSGHCYKCGSSSHFARDCSIIYVPPPIQYVANYKPAAASGSAAASSGSATALGSDSATASSSATVLCERCGRDSHMADKCYALSHMKTGARRSCGICGRLHIGTCTQKTNIFGMSIHE